MGRPSHSLPGCLAGHAGETPQRRPSLKRLWRGPFWVRAGRVAGARARLRRARDDVLGGQGSGGAPGALRRPPRVLRGAGSTVLRPERRGQGLHCRQNEPQDWQEPETPAEWDAPTRKVTGPLRVCLGLCGAHEVPLEEGQDQEQQQQARADVPPARHQPNADAPPSPVLHPGDKTWPGCPVVPHQAEALQKRSKEHSEHARVVIEQVEPVNAPSRHKDETKQVGNAAHRRCERRLRQAVANPSSDTGIDACITKNCDDAFAHGKLGVNAQAQKHDKEQHCPEEAARHLRDGNRERDECQSSSRQTDGRQVTQIISLDAWIYVCELVRKEPENWKHHEAGKYRRPAVDEGDLNGIEDKVIALLAVRSEGNEGSKPNAQGVEDLGHRPQPDLAPQEQAEVRPHEEEGARRRVRQRDGAEEEGHEGDVGQRCRDVDHLAAGGDALADAEVDEQPGHGIGQQHAPVEAAQVLHPAALLEGLLLPEPDGGDGRAASRPHRPPGVAGGRRGRRRGDPRGGAPEVRPAGPAEEPRRGVDDGAVVRSCQAGKEHALRAGVALGPIVPGERSGEGRPYCPPQIVDGPRNDDVVVQGDQEGADGCRGAYTAQSGQAELYPHPGGPLSKHLPQAKLQDEERQAQQQQRKRVRYEKRSATEGVCQVWEAPDVPEPHGVAHQRQQVLDVA
eukprot:CAMPEP_0175634646 /NCGR_PEP_ID=MMETSP0097-20121207/1282_1 /TAXON_ID=311494 /ORGANISM="Alexandrium monilatum, Strain CCMP3105" /LENGTH=677 /DNA_ID=CAMNT_0016940257 /DNA_START=35 /DNA_END=2065 /DNA_ORIENTATION=+